MARPLSSCSVIIRMSCAHHWSPATHKWYRRNSEVSAVKCRPAVLLFLSVSHAVSVCRRGWNAASCISMAMCYLVLLLSLKGLQCSKLCSLSLLSEVQQNLAGLHVMSNLPISMLPGLLASTSSLSSLPVPPLSCPHQALLAQKTEHMSSCSSR